MDVINLPKHVSNEKWQKFWVRYMCNHTARVIQRAYRNHEVKKVVNSLCISVETNFVDEGWAEVDSSVDALLDGYESCESNTTQPFTDDEDVDEIPPKEALTIVKPIKPKKNPTKKTLKTVKNPTKKRAQTTSPTHYKVRKVSNTEKQEKYLARQVGQNNQFKGNVPPIKIDGQLVAQLDAKGNVITVDAVTCEARIWQQITGLSKPIGFKSKVSYPNIRCNRPKYEGCYCKLHAKQVDEGKFWTGNINQNPVDTQIAHIKCKQFHTWLGFGTASGLEISPALQVKLDEAEAHTKISEINVKGDNYVMADNSYIHGT